MTLETLGWNSFFQNQFQQSNYCNNNFTVARVSVQYVNRYDLYSETGEVSGEITGKLRFLAEENLAALPAVGDWVVIQPFPEEQKAIIHSVLERKSQFSRKSAGTEISEQIVASNIDTVFIVTGLDQNYNLRRIERYLLAAWNSGARPIVVLNKADLCDDLTEKIAEVESVAIGVPVLAVSTITGGEIKLLQQFIKPGETFAFIGSSGVGKTSLINKLIGEDKYETGSVSISNSKGKHTTTHRELILLPNGGLVLDTPGMRELQLWEDESGLSTTFEDVIELIAKCKFSNCQHQNEKGCAINEALENQTLDLSRYNNFLKMQKELKYIERKTNKSSAAAEKEKWKKIHSDLKKHPKYNR